MTRILRCVAATAINGRTRVGGQWVQKVRCCRCPLCGSEILGQGAISKGIATNGTENCSNQRCSYQRQVFTAEEMQQRIFW